MRTRFEPWKGGDEQHRAGSGGRRARKPRGDGEEVDHPPHRLLAEEVGVARPAEEADGEELGRHALAARLPRLLVEVEAPLLLVGEGLAAEKEEESRRRHRVEGAERGAAPLEGGPGRERDQEEEEVLVAGDEGGVEDREQYRTEARAEDRPAVVLRAGAIAPLAGEVVGEARAPERGERGHDVEPGVAEAGRRREPADVEGRRYRPEAVDLRVVAGDDRAHPAQGGRSRRRRISARRRWSGEGRAAYGRGSVTRPG